MQICHRNIKNDRRTFLSTPGSIWPCVPYCASSSLNSVKRVTKSCCCEVLVLWTRWLGIFRCSNCNGVELVQREALVGMDTFAGNGATEGLLTAEPSSIATLFLFGAGSFALVVSILICGKLLSAQGTRMFNPVTRRTIGLALGSSCMVQGGALRFTACWYALKSCGRCWGCRRGKNTRGATPAGVACRRLQLPVPGRHGSC